MPWMWILTIGGGLLILRNVPIIGSAVGAVPGVGQIEQFLNALLPYAPLLVAAWIFKDVVTGLISRTIGYAEALVRGVWGLILGILAAVVLMADSLLLGPLAHWAWLHEWGVIILIGLSGLTLALLEGGFGRRIGTGLLILAIAVGTASIIGGWVMERFGLIRVERFEVRVENGAMKMDPRTAVRVKGGEQVSFTVYGMYRDSGGKQYFPAGDLDEFVGREPRGSIFFLVESPDKPGYTARFTLLPVEGMQRSALPSYLAGEIRVPEKVSGILRLGINEPEAVLLQAKGQFTVTMTVDFTKGFLSRMVGLQKFWVPMALIAFIAALAVAYAVSLSAISRFNGGRVGFLVRVGLAAIFVSVGAVTISAAATVAKVSPWHELGKSLPLPGLAGSYGAPGGVERKLTVTLKSPAEWVDIAKRLPARGVLDWDTRGVRDPWVRFSDGSTSPFRGNLEGRGDVFAVKGEGVLVAKWRE